MALTVDVRRDGKLFGGGWVATVVELSITGSGRTEVEAILKAEAAALKELAKRVEKNDPVPNGVREWFVVGGRDHVESGHVRLGPA